MEEKKKERFGILLEEIRDDVKGVAEGHSIIRREMQGMKGELKVDIKEVNDKVRFVAGGLDAVHGSLKKEISATGKALDYGIKELDRKFAEHMRIPRAV